MSTSEIPNPSPDPARFNPSLGGAGLSPQGVSPGYGLPDEASLARLANEIFSTPELRALWIGTLTSPPAVNVAFSPLAVTTAAWRITLAHPVDWPMSSRGSAWSEMPAVALERNRARTS